MNPRLSLVFVSAPWASRSAAISALELDRLELDVEATEGGLLFVSEIFHPAWEARVNGDPVEILRTNGAFRGVVVPAGESTVEFRYAYARTPRDVLPNSGDTRLLAVSWHSIDFVKSDQ